MTIEDVRLLFAAKNCALISTSYKSTHQILDFTAWCGHPAKSSITNFERRKTTLCESCISNLIADKNGRLDIEAVRTLFQDRGCELLSDTYTGVRQELLYKAKCGHNYTRSLHDFKEMSDVCPQCASKLTQLDVETAQQLFNSKGCRLIVESYRGARYPMKFIAQCGHEDTTSQLSAFRAKPSGDCETCVKTKGRISHDDWKNILEKRGLMLLSAEHQPFKPTMVKYVAKCGHEREIRGSDLKKGRGEYCEKCSIRRGYSHAAIRWLTYISKTRNINIQHAENGGEFKLPTTKRRVDGYHAESKTIYQFHGDFWHGNLDCYSPGTYNPVAKRTMGELNIRTMKKDDEIRLLGYNLVIIWESEWRELEKTLLPAGQTTIDNFFGPEENEMYEDWSSENETTDLNLVEPGKFNRELTDDSIVPNDSSLFFPTDHIEVEMSID